MLLSSTGLSLHISSKGWTFQLSPFQLYPRFVAWEEIKNVRMLKPSEMPDGWNLKGFERRFGHAFLISNPAFDILCIELINGFQVFVSVQHRNEMIEFLHHGILQKEMKKKVLA